MTEDEIKAEQNNEFDEEFADEDFQDFDMGQMFMKSFLIIVCGVLIAMMSTFVVNMASLFIFFPEAAKSMGDAGEFRAESMPRMWYYSQPFVLMLFSAIGGYYVARFAPAAPMGHAALLAGVMIMQALTMIVQQTSAEPQWLTMANGVAGPLAVIYGATRGELRRYSSEPDSEVDSEVDLESESKVSSDGL